MQLSDRINQAFANVDFPQMDALVAGSLTEQDNATDLAADLESWRTKIPDNRLLRQMHQELRLLSPAATRWIVPHYLRYALTEEAKYTRMEVSFFVLSLVSHSKEVDKQITTRLSLMNDEQIACVVNVLTHLHADPDWKEYMGEDFEDALSTLMRLVIPPAKP